MALNVKELKAFLVDLGLQDVRHPSNTSFYSHSVGVYEYLETIGSPASLVTAGLFHSIYGAQGFEDFALPLNRRDEIVRLIGATAEHLVYFYCAASDESLQDSLKHNGTPILWDRFQNSPLHISGDEFTGLLWLTLIDVLEQDSRWILKDPTNVGARWAPFLRMVSDRLGPPAVAEWNRVYGRLQIIGQFR